MNVGALEKLIQHWPLKSFNSGRLRLEFQVDGIDMITRLIRKNRIGSINQMQIVMPDLFTEATLSQSLFVDFLFSYEPKVLTRKTNTETAIKSTNSGQIQKWVESKKAPQVEERVEPLHIFIEMDLTDDVVAEQFLYVLEQQHAAKEMGDTLSRYVHVDCLNLTSTVDNDMLVEILNMTEYDYVKSLVIHLFTFPIDTPDFPGVFRMVTRFRYLKFLKLWDVIWDRELEDAAVDSISKLILLEEFVIEEDGLMRPAFLERLMQDGIQSKKMKALRIFGAGFSAEALQAMCKNPCLRRLTEIDFSYCELLALCIYDLYDLVQKNRRTLRKVYAQDSGLTPVQEAKLKSMIK